MLLLGRRGKVMGHFWLSVRLCAGVLPLPPGHGGARGVFPRRRPDVMQLLWRVTSAAAWVRSRFLAA